MPQHITWIDIQNPTPEDLAAIQKKFGFHEVILKELAVPSVRAHIEIYDGYIFFVYNFPLYNSFEQTSRRAEIDFLITKDAVVTVHYEPLEPLTELHAFEAEAPFDLIYAVLRNIFQFEERQLRHIREKLEAIGDGLFKDREKDILKEISFLKRDVSEYRVIVRSGENVLKSLTERGLAVWGEEKRVYLNDLASDHFKIVSQIEDYRDALGDFERTNSQLMYAKTTEVMKTLTSFSFLTFPFMLFATVFAMQVPGSPFAHYQNAFWVIVGIIAFGIVTLAIYFKRKGWL
jgi:magnesium transporter